MESSISGLIRERRRRETKKVVRRAAAGIRNALMYLCFKVLAVLHNFICVASEK